MRFSIPTSSAFAIALFAAGCTSTTKPAEEPVKPTENIAAPFRITPDGIGPLRVDTNPDTDLKALFPSYQVVTDSFQSEGNTYTVYRVLEKGKPVLFIEPWEGRIANVMILDPAIHGPYGIHAGATLEELGSEARSMLGTCFFAAEGKEMILCNFDDAIRLQLTFTTEGMKVSSGWGQPIDVEILAGRVIHGLRWLPPE